MSGFSSPAVSSPCEIKNELTFPPLPNNVNQQQSQQQQVAAPIQQPQQQQQSQVYAEAAKVTPKISQLSELEEQLSRIHQKPFTQQQQQQPQQVQQSQPQQAQSHAPTSYSEAVRQSPTTVQQQFPPVTITQQQQPAIPQQIQPPVALNSIPSPVVTSATPVSQPTSAQKTISRFQVSKVEEQKQAIVNQPQLAPSTPLSSQNLAKPLISPEVEQQVTNVIPQQVIQNTPQMQPAITIPQASQAQAFFQQHQGGVVSRKFSRFFFFFFFIA